MAQSLACLYCHLVFSTKNREPFIEEEFKGRLYAYIGGVIRDRKGVLLAGNGMPDHVHLLVSLARDWSVADLMRDIKSLSSGWVHATFPGCRLFAWQGGYGAFSVSASQLEVVKNYIAQQREHHRTRSFQDEFREFLLKHDITFDERYVWD